MTKDRARQVLSNCNASWKLNRTSILYPNKEITNAIDTLLKGDDCNWLFVMGGILGLILGFVVGISLN